MQAQPGTGSILVFNLSIRSTKDDKILTRTIRDASITFYLQGKTRTENYL